MEEVICPFKNKCAHYEGKCKSCKNNDGKKDYYLPDDTCSWVNHWSILPYLVSPPYPYWYSYTVERSNAAY